MDKTKCCNKNFGYNIAPRAGTNRACKRTPAVIEGMRKISSKGPYTFMGPDGLKVTRDNLLIFASEFSLTHQNLWSVLKGRASHHKGWTLPKE